MEINNFRRDLTDILAKTVVLGVTWLSRCQNLYHKLSLIQATAAVCGDGERRVVEWVVAASDTRLWKLHANHYAPGRAVERASCLWPGALRPEAHQHHLAVVSQRVDFHRLRLLRKCWCAERDNSCCLTVYIQTYACIMWWCLCISRHRYVWRSNSCRCTVHV